MRLTAAQVWSAKASGVHFAVRFKPLAGLDHFMHQEGLQARVDAGSGALHALDQLANDVPIDVRGMMPKMMVWRVPPYQRAALPYQRSWRPIRR